MGPAPSTIEPEGAGKHTTSQISMLGARLKKGSDVVACRVCLLYWPWLSSKSSRSASRTLAPLNHSFVPFCVMESGLLPEKDCPSQ